MMSHRQKAAAFWLGGLLLVLILLVVFRQILLPFIAGAAFAYALHPAADWLERRGLSRFAAAGAIQRRPTRLGVQRAERFIEQQQRRLRGQRSGHSRALPLPAR